MTDQSPNDQFHASSFMQGHNGEDLEQMHAFLNVEEREAAHPFPALFGKAMRGVIG